MILTDFLKFMFLWLLLPPTPDSTELICSGNGLTFSVFDPDGSSFPSLVSTQNLCYQAIWIWRLYQRYQRERRGLHCWNSSTFNVNVKQPCGNKTEHFGSRALKMCCLLAVFLCDHLTRSSPSLHPFPLLSYPTLTPQPVPSTSLFCTAIQLTQAPASRLSPWSLQVLSQTKWSFSQTMSTPLQGTCAGGIANILSPSITLKSINLIENLLWPNAEDTQNWKNTSNNP